MEERYINVSRRSSGRRGGDGHEPPRREAPPHKRSRGGRSPAVSLLMGVYKALVVVSVLIVAGYVGFQLMIKEPEQAPVPPPTQAGVSPSGNGGGGTASGSGSSSGERLERRKQILKIKLMMEV